ncbi:MULTISPECIES: hypothetical protein [Serratia]|uniref:Uncharacterized protein n=1 Tax=Serratia quinivorans TaxID=137545 RepID=A0A380A3R3_9GAMM|nr:MULTISPECIES: hypothetical protein [Serratia]RYM57996.1 hypothetical protein BSR03_23130 [Serratia proteamaculans]CAI2022745.1 Uncharacterised protein [Serratia quinivorans]SUI73887.1 Uncharacterised protein [Serratia quinivorans]
MKTNSAKRKTHSITVTVNLNIKEGFTGMVVVQMDNGSEKGHYPLRGNEFTGSLESFLNTASIAGYQVIPPAAQVKA